MGSLPRKVNVKTTRGLRGGRKKPTNNIPGNKKTSATPTNSTAAIKRKQKDILSKVTPARGGGNNNPNQSKTNSSPPPVKRRHEYGSISSVNVTAQRNTGPHDIYRGFPQGLRRSSNSPRNSNSSSASSTPSSSRSSSASTTPRTSNGNNPNAVNNAPAHNNAMQAQQPIVYSTLPPNPAPGGAPAGGGAAAGGGGGGAPVGGGGGGAPVGGGGGGAPGGGGGGGNPGGGNQGAGMQQFQFAGGGPPAPGRASRLFDALKRHPKRTGFGGLAILLGLGATGSAPVWVPALVDLVDGNDGQTPVAAEATTKGKRTRDTKSKTGIKNSPLEQYDLLQHIDPANDSAEAKIKADSVKLYKTLEITEAGSKSINNNGAWSVDEKGKLSFVPSDDFIAGKAVIFFTAEDKRNLVSNKGSLTIQYGPNANNADLKDQPLDKASASFDVSKNVTPVSRAKDFAIDTSSVELVYRDDTGGEKISNTSLEVDGGTWSVSEGKISFTPGEGFVRQMVMIGYQVKDEMGSWSNEAILTLHFMPKGMMMGTDSKAKPDLRYMPEMVVNRQPFELSISSTNVAIKTSSVEISTTAQGPFGKTLVIENEGTWSVESGKIKFSPVTDFRKAPSRIFFRAESTNGISSDPFLIAMEIFPKPQARDDNYPGLRATIDVLSNDTAVYAMEDNKLNPKSVEFYALTPKMGEEPMVEISADRKTATVAGQGKWSINSRTGKVSFVPEDGFKGVPTPISYTVMDTKGSESDPAFITINKSSAKLQNMIAAMGGLSQTEFWDNFQMSLAGQPLDVVLVVAYQLRKLFLDMLSPERVMDIRTAPGITQDQRDNIFDKWMDADFSLSELVRRSGVVTQKNAGLQVDGNAIGVRVLRLEEVMNALDKYFDAFEQAV